MNNNHIEYIKVAIDTIIRALGITFLILLLMVGLFGLVLMYQDNAEQKIIEELLNNKTLMDQIRNA